MDYGFDEDQEAYRQTVRRFAAKVLAPHYQSDDKTATFRRQQALDMAAMGLTGLRIPTRYGGQEASAVIAGIATEEVGRADSVPWRPKKLIRTSQSQAKALWSNLGVL